MKNTQEILNKKYDIVVIGTGISCSTIACLLANEGLCEMEFEINENLNRRANGIAFAFME